MPTNKNGKPPGASDSFTEMTEPLIVPIIKKSKFNHLIELLGGRDVDEEDYIWGLRQAKRYLDAVYGEQMSFFSVGEITAPRHPKIAYEVGYEYFLPPTHWWPRMACIRLICDRVRLLVNEPIHIKNYWRPQIYNDHRHVGGVPNSAHVEACAADLVFRSRKAIQQALKYFFEPLWLSPINFDLGLGVGSRTIHFDVLSSLADEREAGGQERRRWWRYKSEADYGGPRSRWRFYD